LNGTITAAGDLAIHTRIGVVSVSIIASLLRIERTITAARTARPQAATINTKEGVVAVAIGDTNLRRIIDRRDHVLARSKGKKDQSEEQIYGSTSDHSRSLHS
jgi:hypothetical protein